MTDPTKARLLEAAIQLIIESRDLGGVSSRQIAGRAQASLGLITYHFGSKENLLREAIRLFISRVIGAWGSAAPEDNDPFQTLLADLRALCGLIWDHPRVARASILFDQEQPGPDDNTHQTIAHLASRIQAIAGANLDLAEARQAAQSLVFTIQGSFLRAGQQDWPDAGSRGLWLQKLAEMLIRGPSGNTR